MTTRTIRRRTGRRHAPRSVRTAATVVLLVLIVVAFAQLIAPEPRDALSLATRLAAPSATHWLGTDELGRDVLSRTIYSTQTSVLIAACATILSGLIGAVMGTLAGWFGGTIDTMVSFVIDIQSSIPAFILALGAVVFFGGSPIALVLVLALEGWERIARILRAEVMAARRSGYINAALNLGVPTGTVIRHHLLRALFAPWACCSPWPSPPRFSSKAPCPSSDWGSGRRRPASARWSVSAGNTWPPRGGSPLFPVS